MLEEAVARALEHAPKAKIARLETLGADDDRSAAESSYWPHLEMSSQAGWSNRLDERLNAVDSKGREREYGLSSIGSREGWFNVFVKQLLFDLSEWRLIEESEIEAEVARISEAHEREAVTFDVLSQYVEVLRLERLCDLDRESVESAEWLDEQAAYLLEAGRCLSAQREEVGLYLDHKRTDAAIGEGELASARVALVLAIGDPDLHADSLVLDSASLPALSAEPHGEPAAKRVEDAPEVRILAMRRRAAEVRIAAASAARYPKVDVVAGYSHYGVKRYDNFPDEVHVGVDFHVPLFDGFRTKHVISRALRDLEIARLRHRSMLDTKVARVRHLIGRLATAQRQSELVRRQADLSAEQVRLADLKLRSQRGGLEAALAARAARARDARAAIEGDYERIRLWATLQRETGLLARAIMGEPDETKTSPES